MQRKIICAFLGILLSAVLALPLVLLAPQTAKTLEWTCSVQSESLPKTTDTQGSTLECSGVVAGFGGESSRHSAYHVARKVTWKPYPERPDDLFHLALCDGGFAEVIIGADFMIDEIQKLKETISFEGGKISGEMYINKNVQAFKVMVPIDRAQVLAEKLRADRQVRFVEPNLMVEVHSTPNDEYWNLQWGAIKIEADWAWNTTMGSHDVLVAVIDSGVDYTHPDLANNYVALGYDWHNNDMDPLDDYGHGTHVAGIIAALANNSIGIAGSAQVRIMAEKVLGKTGRGDTWNVANGIVHAANQSAKVISMSLGSHYDVKVLRDAVQYAYDAGVLLVASAGNDREDIASYPAAYSEVIAVSATDENDTLAAFSTFGSWIEVAAPGVSIYSTMPTYNVTMNDPPSNKSRDYDYMSGTSMACPYVSGVAALVWSAHSNLTRDEVRLLLRHSADDLFDVGHDVFYGDGRVNARRAVAGFQEHDLSITKWQHPYRLDPGKSAIFNATISNYGNTTETDISVEFLVNDTLTDFSTIDSLENGTSVNLQFVWGAATTGVYNVTCFVVPVPGENITVNNRASYCVSVRFPVFWRVPEDCETIKEAISYAYEGDTVLVSEGYYNESQILVFSHLHKDNITLAASGNVILDGLQKVCLFNIRANFVSVEGFVITNCSTGILVRGSGASIKRNVIINNSRHGYGIVLDGSLKCNISLNEIANNGVGVWLDWFSCDSIVSMNNVTANNACGIVCINGCYNNTISGNTISENGYSSPIWDIVGSGVQIGTSLRCSVIRNNLSSNNRRGIWVDESLETIIVGNNLTNDGIFVRDALLVENNTVNGRPLIYLKGMSDHAVENAGQVILVDCTCMRVENLDLSNTTVSVMLVRTNNSIIANNKMAYNGWAGISLSFANNNTVFRNNLTANYWDGAVLGSSSLNNITENIIVMNGYIGLDLWWSDNNYIYHNSFINNRGQAFVSADRVNIWDDGHPSGGNYWSNGANIDTNGDGIADDCYVIDADNQDNYPLMSPYSYWKNPIVGDLNRDMKVDIKDIAMVAVAYGSYPGHPKWNPNVDITGPEYGVPDGKVDIRDIAVVARNFGKTST